MGKNDHYPERLLRTPTPLTGESLMGYILRLTQENGYATPAWVFELAGLKINLRTGGAPKLYREAEDLTALQRVIGLTRPEFDGMRYRQRGFDNSVLVSGNRLPPDSIRFVSPKVCPGCLRQDDYYRVAWDLFPFTACPTHKTILIDRCLGCGKRLSWERKRVGVCRCGFDWRAAAATDADPSSLEVSRQILKLMYPSPSDSAAVGERCYVR